jgi:hypothetical protein
MKYGETDAFVTTELRAYEWVFTKKDQNPNIANA